MQKRNSQSACPDARQGAVKTSANALKTTFLLLVALVMPAASAADNLDGRNLLSSETFTLWSTRRFEGETEYVWIPDEGTGHVRASSRKSASARYYRHPVDLTQTPWLSWRWRVVDAMKPGDERSRSGDDYAARVYVVYASNFWPGSVRSLNYVWSQQEPVGTHWPNPFTDKAIMVPLRQGGSVGVWQQEQRNIIDDFRTYFGLEIDDLKGVAIMTDTDNSGQEARADYADMRFYRHRPALP